MNKNIAFLVHDGRTFISLHSISKAIDLPENTLRGLLFNEEVDKGEYVHTKETFYLSEKAACGLLTDMNDLGMTAQNLDRFHIWMHRAFEEMEAKQQDSAVEDPCENCDRPDCIGCEHENDDDGSCDLGEFLEELVRRVEELELSMKTQEKEH